MEYVKTNNWNYKITSGNTYKWDNLFVITETLFDGIREDEILALRQ